MQSAIKCHHEEEDGGQFADRENCYEGERIHPADVRLPIRHIHRAPQEAGAHRRNNAAYRTVRRTLVAVNGAESKHYRSR